jgi:hypothetical protein
VRAEPIAQHLDCALAGVGSASNDDGLNSQSTFETVSWAMVQTPRSSSLVGNLNSRRRVYFTQRRHPGSSCLDLLWFFLNRTLQGATKRTQHERPIGGVILALHAI